MKLYKLTDKNHTTRNATKWGEGVEHTAPGGGELCTVMWLHAYRTPEQAAFMAPRYGYAGEVLWEADGDVGIDDGTKVGCTRLKTLCVVPMPELTTEQRVEIAIRCAMIVYKGEKWTQWARDWLDGKNRGRSAATYAAYVASVATYDAYAANATYAAYAANAANAAYDAAYAAYAEKLAPSALIDIIEQVVNGRIR
jgi:hypothetical protein